MDIWKWVGQTKQSLKEEGNTRLAYIIDRLPTMTCNDQHEEVEALMPEGVALAKQLNLPWVELFLRHWHMQSAILHRYDTKGRMNDVIELLEFSHTHHNQACPQSVCTTQDVAVAYALLDGKGYVQERLDVAQESLDRIDPTWPCFGCISCEYANALIDDEKYEQAEQFVLQQFQTLKDSGAKRWKDPELVESLVTTLLAQDRAQEALEHREETWRAYDSGHRSITHVLDMARIHARLGNNEEAINNLPDWDTIWRTPAFYERMADALYHLISSNEPALPNIWKNGCLFGKMATRLLELGVYRISALIAHQGLKLALERDQPYSAKWYLDLACDAAENLRDPSDFDTLHDDFDEQIKKALAAHPTPGEHAINEAKASDDPEHILWLLSKVALSDDIVLIKSSGYCRLGRFDEALAVLREQLQNPETELQKALIWESSEIYKAQNKGDQLHTFLNQFINAPQSSSQIKALCHLFICIEASENKRWQVALENLESALALDDVVVNWRCLKAQILRNMHDYTGALALLNEHIANVDDAQDIHWERMLVGVLANRWDATRESATILGWQFGPGDTPIDIPFQMCQIVCTQKGEQQIYWAQRISPVTARIVSLAKPDHEQHYEDVVVFEPKPLNAPPEDLPEDETFVVQFEYISTIESGQYHESYVLDGFHPDEQWTSLVEALELSGIIISQRSGAAYTLPWTHEDETQENEAPAVYAYVGVPKSLTLSQACDLLAEHTQHLDRPLVWPELALGADSFERYEQQRKIMKKHNISD